MSRSNYISKWGLESSIPWYGVLVFVKSNAPYLFHVSLGRAGFADRMARIPTPERLPVMLDTQAVALLLTHARSGNDRAALNIAYGCGIHVSEIASLKVADIDRARMLIRAEQGRGRKDRYVMLGVSNVSGPSGLCFWAGDFSRAPTIYGDRLRGRS